jgi:hypothetical protein
MKKALILYMILSFGCQTQKSNSKEFIEDKVWVSIYSGGPQFRYYYSNGNAYLSSPVGNTRKTKQFGANQFSDNPFSSSSNGKWKKTTPYHKISNDTLYFTSKSKNKQVHVLTLKVLPDTIINNNYYYKLQVTNRNILQDPPLKGLTHTLISKK